jgi:hypothetical protein
MEIKDDTKETFGEAIRSTAFCADSFENPYT